MAQSLQNKLKAQESFIKEVIVMRNIQKKYLVAYYDEKDKDKLDALKNQKNLQEKKVDLLIKENMY